MKNKAVVKAVVSACRKEKTMLYNSKITGQIIGLMRTQRGMSQEVLSGLAGIARSHLAMIENGRKSASVETLWRVAQALDIRLSDLIRLVEERLEQEEKEVPPTAGREK